MKLEVGKECRKLLDNILDGLLVIDENMDVLFANQAVAKLYGFESPEEGIGVNILNFVHPEDIKRTKKIILEDMFEKDLQEINEFRTITKDGRELWIAAAGKVIKYEGKLAGLISIRDITEQKKMERALRESEAYYKAIFENTGAATIIVDEDNTISTANKEVEKLLDCPREEIEGKKSWTEFVLKEYLEKMREYHRLRRIKPEAAPKKYEAGIIDRHGNVKNVFLNVGMIPGTKKSVASILDITEHKKIQKALEKSLEEKEALLREIHHRVKNSLQVILSLLGLRLRYIGDEKALEFFKEIQNYIKAMARVHEELYESDSLVEVDFASYIKSMVPEIISSHGASPDFIKTKIEIEDVSFSIETAIPLALLINELVSNCIKHAFPKGKGEIRINLNRYKDKYLLSVADNGIGIPEEFDIKKTETLGLKLVNTFVKQLNGEIGLERDEWTTFKIKF